MPWPKNDAKKTAETLAKLRKKGKELDAEEYRIYLANRGEFTPEQGVVNQRRMELMELVEALSNTPTHQRRLLRKKTRQ